MTTLRVRSTHPHTQGEYVIIDAEHYDPAVHVLYDEAPAAPEPAPQPDKPAPGKRGKQTEVVR